MYNSTGKTYYVTIPNQALSSGTAWTVNADKPYTDGQSAGVTAGATAAGVRISGTRIERVASSATKYYDISAGTPSYSYNDSIHGYSLTATAYADRTTMDTETTTTDDTAWQYGYASGYYKGMEDYISTTANWDDTVQYTANNGYYIKIPNLNNTGSQVYSVDATKPYNDGASSVTVNGVTTGEILSYATYYLVGVNIYLTNGKTISSYYVQVPK